MVALISRVLIVSLAVYSYFRIKINLPENLPGAPAATAARLLLALQILSGILFFLIPFFPEAIHFGSRTLADYTPRQLERIMPLLRDMIGLMGLLMTLYFAANIQLLVAQALSSTPRGVARAIVRFEPWLVGGLLVGQAVTIFYYLHRFDQATDDTESSDDC